MNPYLWIRGRLGLCTCPRWFRRVPAARKIGRHHAWACPLYGPSEAERR